MRSYKLLFLILASSLSFTQANAQAKKHKLTVIARAYGDSIVLRWAPGSATAWQAANKHGFFIERYVLMKDTVQQTRPEGKLLTPQPLLPWELKKWKSIVEKDKYGALAAQALYGKTFQLSTGRMGDVTQIYQKVKEEQARFSMALFAADVSQSVAGASALRFTDRTVKKGERYVYRVYTPSQQVQLDTGFVYIGADDRADLPKPLGVQASFTKGSAVITWDRTYGNDIYSAYFIERSGDGGASFAPVNDLPLVSTYAGEESPDRAVYTDSLPVLNQEFHYRIRGITAFAETGPVSDAVSVRGTVSAEATPVITQAVPVNNREVHLTWSFPARDEHTIREFRIERATKASGDYVVLKKEVSVKERKFVDPAPLSNGYYRVAAIGADQSVKLSFPHLVQLIDSLPPSAPVALAGTMDSTGSVTLTWRKSPAPDLRGYRVYRANFGNDEYFQVTSGTVADTVFVDRVSTKTLTKSVFYKVVAVDHHYNPSDFSSPVAIQRYDNLPPVAPVITDYRALPEGIILEWRASSSADVAETKLFRRVKGQEAWKPLAVFTAADTARRYVDRDLSANRTYEYTLRAYDVAGNESEEGDPVSLRKINKGVKAPVTDIQARADRQQKKIVLTWRYDEGGAAKFSIYRQIDDGPLTLYTTIPGVEKEFSDKALRVNTRYTYRIKATARDGAESPMTENIVVKY